MNQDRMPAPETMYVVEYSGPFGFIKPWTAVRDGTTYSQAFVTPSIIEGLRQKLGVSGISRHRLRHRGINMQQERTQGADWKVDSRQATRPRSIITRGVMIQPALTLAFESQDDAEKAAAQHVCLCRNEDVLLPLAMREVSVDEFESLAGVELRFGQSADAFLVGFNRFNAAAPMYGNLIIVEPDGDEEEFA